MGQTVTPEFLSLLTSFLKYGIYSLGTLNSIKLFSCDILIPACNNLYLIVYYQMQLLLCAPFSDLGVYCRTDCGILFFSLHFLLDSVCLTQKELLEQLQVSFVTRSKAQHDVMGKALDLGLRVFCLMLVLTCCMTLGTACHPCVSLSLLVTLDLSFPLDATGKKPLFQIHIL